VNRGSDDLVKLVARLYYIDGLGQSEVAEIAGISRSQVSRVLTRARETGIVRISVEEYQARSRELEDDLVASFGLKHAIVVRTAPDAAAESVRRTVGYFAVPFVSELIRPGTVLGVAGGRTIYELVRHLMPTNGAEGATVVQLMGNIGASVNNTDAIEMCRTTLLHGQCARLRRGCPVTRHIPGPSGRPCCVATLRRDAHSPGRHRYPERFIVHRPGRAEPERHRVAASPRGSR
jgi:DNA-binding transcriptional regulator LsrR (DeoR family)